jgi:hypothetical protein
VRASHVVATDHTIMCMLSASARPPIRGYGAKWATIPARITSSTSHLIVAGVRSRTKIRVTREVIVLEECSVDNYSASRRCQLPRYHQPWTSAPVLGLFDTLLGWMPLNLVATSFHLAGSGATPFSDNFRQISPAIPGSCLINCYSDATELSIMAPHS